MPWRVLSGIFDGVPKHGTVKASHRWPECSDQRLPGSGPAPKSGRSNDAEESMSANIVLFEDALGPYTLAELVRTAKTWTPDPKRQRQLVESYLAGQGRLLPPRLEVKP